MTIHLFFVTITIERRRPAKKDREQERLVQEIEEEILDRKCLLQHRPF
jgi:uncharacterized protein (TIGR02413 family)